MTISLAFKMYAAGLGWMYSYLNWGTHFEVLQCTPYFYSSTLIKGLYFLSTFTVNRILLSIYFNLYSMPSTSQIFFFNLSVNILNRNPCELGHFDFKHKLWIVSALMWTPAEAHNSDYAYICDITIMYFLSTSMHGYSDCHIDI